MHRPCPTLVKHIPQDARKFSSLQYLEELGKGLCERAYGSEQDLTTYQRLAIEKPIADIIEYRKQSEHSRNEFNLADGIMFENHTNTLP